MTRVIDVMDKMQDIDLAIKKTEANNLTEVDRNHIVQFLKDYKQYLESREVN